MSPKNCFFDKLEFHLCMVIMNGGASLFSWRSIMFLFTVADRLQSLMEKVKILALQFLNFDWKVWKIKRIGACDLHHNQCLQFKGTQIFAHYDCLILQISEEPHSFKKLYQKVLRFHWGLQNQIIFSRLSQQTCWILKLVDIRMLKELQFWKTDIFCLLQLSVLRPKEGSGDQTCSGGGGAGSSFQRNMKRRSWRQKDNDEVRSLQNPR